MCKSKKKFQKDSSSKLQSTAKYAQEEEQEESSDLDFAFQVRLALAIVPLSKFESMGVKRRMEADTCSTANIIDEHKLEKNP